MSKPVPPVLIIKPTTRVNLMVSSFSVSLVPGPYEESYKSKKMNEAGTKLNRTCILTREVSAENARKKIQVSTKIRHNFKRFKSKQVKIELLQDEQQNLSRL